MRPRHRRVPDGPHGPAAVRRRSKFLALPLVALAVGCTVGPDWLRPAAPDDKTYTQQGKAEQGTNDQHIALGQKITGDWWTLYRSEPMNQVLEQAVAGNRSLAGAEATLVAAQEAVNQARAGLFPQIDASGGAQREHISGAEFGLNRLPPGFPPYSNLFRVGANVGYLIDIWGATRRTIEQSEALADTQDFTLDAAYLTITGNSVAELLTIASLNSQIATVRDIIADDERNYRLVQTEVNAGVATQLDIETARSQLATDRTLMPPLYQQVNVARHALAVLAGRAPDQWSPPDFTLDDITLPGELPVSLPSDLVRQRPDILASEAELHAASAAIGIATAAFYPSITLNGSLAQQSITTDTLFHGAGDVWSFGANISAPIFHGGALTAQKRRAEASFESARDGYEETVLSAFAQVADVLDALAQDAELLTEQQQALFSAQASLDLTRRAYSLGSISVLQVVDAQRILEQARLGYVRARAQRYLDTAQLFVAMGGGWWDWREQDGDGAVKPVAIMAPAK
jgi:NodT family efflux transporter outer membrane factor (OMF) lipoprotein